MIAKGAGEGTVVAAGGQTKGRGKPGSSWYSPPDVGLYFSVILKPHKDPRDLVSLTSLVAEVVVKTIKLTVSLEAKIKLPNDVLLNGKKVCGILCERVAAGYLIVGIGVNVNNAAGSFPAGLKDSATSLLIETGRVQDRENLLSLLLAELERTYLAYLSKVC